MSLTKDLYAKYLETVDDESKSHVQRNLDSFAGAINGTIGLAFVGGFCKAVWNNDLTGAFNNADIAKQRNEVSEAKVEESITQGKSVQD